MTDPRALRPGAQPQASVGQLLARVVFGEDEVAAGTGTRGPVDWWIVSAVLALTIFGLVMVFSASAIEATSSSGSPTYYLVRQGIAAGIGLVGMVLFARCPVHRLGRVGWVLYFACLVGLVAVFVPGIGHRANGAVRWISFGALRLQPSEFMKLALVLVVAERVNRYPDGLADLGRRIAPVLLVTVPVLALVLEEPDFGTTAILAGTVGLVLFLGGAPMRWVAVLAAACCLAGIGLVAADPYRLERVLAWLHPWENQEGSGYQVIMGWVALHYGGLWGQGLGEAMSSMKWLPFAHTDFIAAVTGEELGFARFLLVLAMFAVLLWRGIRVSCRARTYFGGLAAGALTLLLGAQALFNLGVVLGLVPPKGLVLPFMSYGASALIAQLWCVGALLSISTELEQSAVAEAGTGGGRGLRVRVLLAQGLGLARAGRLARAPALRRSAP